MSHFTFNNNVPNVLNVMDAVDRAFLEEVGGEVMSQAMRNTAVDTGKTKGSWKYAVNPDGKSVVVGNTSQNAIWEELGTGEFSEDFDNEVKGKYNSVGRKGGWWIPVGNGEGMIPLATAEKYHMHIETDKHGMKFAYTKGKKARHMLYSAYKTLQPKIERRLEQLLNGGLR